ncbi:MAG: hypothetical protein K1X65_13690 [Caldilineales bacterium]|nr:hypothetical protein [Caldilineales bacterium]MCW5856822.1 hypothetical protein [Caldilineales bacterium]
MTTQTLDLADAIYQEALQLPLDSLLDLAKFVEFLRFKARQEQPEEASELRIVRLRGILKDYDVSPEALAAARREMWRKLDSSPS